MKTKLFLLIMALALFTFSSCTKNTNPIETKSAEIVDDDAVTDAAFDDVFNSVDIATTGLENSFGKGGDSKSLTLADSCPLVTVTSTNPEVWPKTITIDYGAGCTGTYGNVRKGKIIIVLTARRNVVNATRTVTFENYFFNEIKMEGTKEFKNLGFNTSQNLEFSVKLTAGKLTLPDGKTIERSFTHKNEWIAGMNTPRFIGDDEWLITGTATGKNIDDITYTNTIITALHKKMACRFIVSGTVKFERSGVEPVVLDYGTGECDAKATITRGDLTKEILLKFRHRLMQ
jgi:hypothetical protein